MVHRPALLALLLALMGPAAALAQDPEAEAVSALQRMLGARPKDKAPPAPGREAFLVSASNRLEQAWGAPAQVIILTRDDLLARGYRDLTEIFDDLPGIDVARPFGDAQVKPYWRGDRNTQGDPFLVLVDGREANDLWLREAQHLLHAFPLSAIERVEVLYGPTSVLYGSNAMVGLIHIVTIANQAQEGWRTWGSLEAGDLRTRAADLTQFLKRGDLRIRLSARLFNAESDERNVDAYEYTRRAYLSDTRIWSRGFLDNPGLRLEEAPRLATRAFQLWGALGGTEAGIAYLDRRSGYGVQYARDQIQAQGDWVVPAWEIHAKHVAARGPALESSTALRWRKDGFDPRSWDLEAYFDPAAGSFLNRYSHWRVENRSWSMTQDLDWWINRRWSVNAGIRWEAKTLQKAYDFGRDWAPIATAVYPEPLPPGTPAANLMQVRTAAGYLQTRWRPAEGHLAHAGLRIDRHSEFGTNASIRAGYTGRHRAWSWKLLFGQAFQEPSQRTLYGGYLQVGSDPNLRPERSSTWEGALTQELSTFRHTLGLYRVEYTDTVTYQGNLGNRTVVGLDWQGSWRPPLPGLDEAQVSAFASFFLQAQGSPRGNFGLTTRDRIGDLSDTKLWLELRVRRGPWSGTLRGRYLTGRPTVATNPVGRVPAQGTADVTFTRRIVGRFDLRLAVDNLFDRVVFHPGIHAADAGTTPGAFVTDGLGQTHWLGSGGLYDGARGFYASLLPQPGRTLRVSLQILP